MVPNGYERARIANLLHFAALTPTQRVQWLTDMFELMCKLRRPGGIANPDEKPDGPA